MRIKPDFLTQEEWDSWAWCSIIGCNNKSCLALDSKYCYPHTDNKEGKKLLEESIKQKQLNELKGGGK